MNNTLAMIEQLAQKLGFLGDSIVCKQILVGNYELPLRIDRYRDCKLFIFEWFW